MKRWGVVKLCLAVSSLASAQVPAPPERGPAERPPLPEFRKAPPQPRFELPPPPVYPSDRLSGGVRIVVSRFRVTGATAFPAEELQKLLEPFSGRPIGNEELEEARLAITRKYVSAGYVSSGAIIPDQEVRDGTVEIRVIEGRLAGMTVAGEHGFRPEFVESRMALGAGPPLNVARVQERMQLLLQNPQIERINAELGAGTRPGEALLRLDVTEAPRGTWGAAIANNRSPAIGSARGEISFAYRNPSGRGDALGFRVGAAEGLGDFLATYALPVSARDTALALKFERVDTQIVEAPFDLLDIENESEYAEVGLFHPVYRTLERRLDLGASLTRRTNASFLLGQPFSFSPGLEDGRSVVTALRLSADWVDRGLDQVFAARLTLSRGIDALGATILPGEEPDSRFTTGLAQVQLARRLGSRGDQVLLRADWQDAGESLLASEKFALGGAQSVRGYRENALVRDNGWVVSAEYRRPLPGGLEGALFADHGESREHRGPRDDLSSVGVGLRWSPFPGVVAQLYKGFALVEPESRTSDLQDRGIHFSVAVQRSL